jgi:hypothetical protein
MRRKGRSRRGSATCSSSAAASNSAATTTTPEEALQELMEWLAMEGFPEQVRMANMMGCFACCLKQLLAADFQL